MKKEFQQLFNTNFFCNFILRIEIHLFPIKLLSRTIYMMKNKGLGNLKQNFSFEIYSIDHYRKK